MAEVVEESEETRLARVKELEEIVKKLESENRQLLNKVSAVRLYVFNNIGKKGGVY